VRGRGMRLKLVGVLVILEEQLLLQSLTLCNIDSFTPSIVLLLQFILYDFGLDSVSCKPYDVITTVQHIQSTWSVNSNI